MASRPTLQDVFATAKKEQRAAFIPYITCGFPTIEDTLHLMQAMQDGGADIIELGVPFSDPMADGPTIQEANQVALVNGTSLHDVLNTVCEARKVGVKVPVILMGYLNPFLAYGTEKLMIDAKEAGVDGFIIVDLPPEEASLYYELGTKHGLALVPLVAPTTTDQRLAKIAETATGYVYCVSLTGVTGARTELPADLQQFMERVRRYTPLPLAVGFGLSTRQHVLQVQKYADGAVIGSQVVKTVKNGGDTTESRANALRKYCQEVTGN